MDDYLAIVPVSMAEFYQIIGLTANGSVPESLTKLDATEYPTFIGNITTQAANFTQHILIEQLQNDATVISISNAVSVTVDGYVETPADLQYRREETGEYTLYRANFFGIDVKTWVRLYNGVVSSTTVTANLNSCIAQWIKWVIHGAGDNKKYCGSQVFTNIFIDGQEGWSLFVKTWSTNNNCDMTASKEDLACAVRASVSSMYNRGKTAFCVPYIHGSSWRGELRVVANRAWSRYWPWNIDCPSVSNFSVGNNDCFDQAQG